jgi:hypothetical protein
MRSEINTFTTAQFIENFQILVDSTNLAFTKIGEYENAGYKLDAAKNTFVEIYEKLAEINRQYSNQKNRHRLKFIRETNLQELYDSLVAAGESTTQLFLMCDFLEEKWIALVEARDKHESYIINLDHLGFDDDIAANQFVTESEIKIHNHAKNILDLQSFVKELIDEFNIDNYRFADLDSELVSRLTEIDKVIKDFITLLDANFQKVSHIINERNSRGIILENIVNSTSISDELGKLAELYDQGLLNEEQFEEAKSILFKKMKS